MRLRGPSRPRPWRMASPGYRHPPLHADWGNRNRKPISWWYLARTRTETPSCLPSGTPPGRRFTLAPLFFDLLLKSPSRNFLFVCVFHCALASARRTLSSFFVPLQPACMFSSLAKPPCQPFLSTRCAIDSCAGTSPASHYSPFTMPIIPPQAIQ